ncbi:MAG TPA: signal recognition particle-docking protein FtsY [Propionicimonas sp.]|nr:signal recognition particle-docking protein FtsY [Propionicimonas sp.]
MAAVGLVLVVAAVTIVVGRRRALPPPPPVPELPPEPSAGPAEAAADADVAIEPDVVPLETPEPPASRLSRLRRRLSASNNPFARGLLGLLAADRLDAEAWDDLEATLITSDLGVGPTDELITALRREAAIDGVSDPARARDVLRAELLKLIGTDADRSLNVAGANGVPGVILVVGVNGTGKTTTIGKLARVLVAEGNSVLLAAADTFRAAAADQLQTWGARVGVRVIRGAEGADPASVAHDAVAAGIEEGVDVVVVDTAGRLHTKTGLMDELGKIKRVIDRLAPVTEVLLVIDATTGQNGLAQARVFAEVVDVTGIVLSKLDGSAKGGIVVPVQRELGVPVKLIGLGEGADDLAPFEPEGFVDALLGES